MAVVNRDVVVIEYADLVANAQDVQGKGEGP